MPSSSNRPSPRGGALQIEGVRREFGSVAALNGVSLQVNAGEFFSLLGPSGCGKTTLLRIIAGLDEPASGSVLLDGDNLLGMPAHQRPVNTVFQSYALFPHLNVADNIGFGLRMKKMGPTEIKRRVDAMLELVEVEKLATRKPTDLSGGQRQRVALARALVNEPRVLLLDEPLAAVDQKLRKQLQSDLLSLQRRLGLTFIYVTHDQEEALSLSDRLAVMNHGEIVQIGSPRNVYDHPQTRFAAEFLGNSNLIDAGVHNGVTRTGFGKVDLGNPGKTGRVTLFFRPEKVVIGEGMFEGTIEEIVFGGLTNHISIRSGGQLIKATALNQNDKKLAVGNTIRWSIAAEDISVFGLTR